MRLLVVWLTQILWHASLPWSVDASSPREGFAYTREKIPEHCGRNAYDTMWSDVWAPAQLPPSLVPQKVDKRIVGGKESRNGEWPWLTSLMFHQTAEQVARQREDALEDDEGTGELFVPASLVTNFPDGSRRFHICGGTLIHPQWLLTAAHCFVAQGSYPDLTTDAKQWIVRVGEHDMLNENVPHYDMEVEKVIVDLNYQGAASGHDIALMKLKRPVPLSKRVNIACLPAPGEIAEPGLECYSVGWGHEASNAKNISTVLQHVPVTIVPNYECNLNYITLRTDSETFGANIMDSMICAGHPEGGKDSCQFDSGGPLACQINGQWRVSGIISFGHGCGMAGFPGIYTRVSDYVHWIQSVVQEL